jgi:peptidoglycan/LPS O-acetylase OafA/YrhL
MTSKAAGQMNLDIEVLRATAILFTVIFHIDFLLFWGDATVRSISESFTFWGGVDLFFCVSGFVIMRSLRTAIARPDLDLSGFLRVAAPFWVRRACRLWPSAWLWLAITVVCAFAFNASGAFGDSRRMFSDAIAALIHASNFHWLECLHYGGTQCNTGAPTLHIYWSLSLEEQFYFLLPFAVILLPRKRLVVGLAVLIAAQVFLHRPHWSPMWSVRTDSLMMGALIALWQDHPSYRALEPVILRRRWVAMPVVAVLVVLLAALPSKLEVVSFSTGSLAICCAALVWFASYDRDYLWPPGMGKRALVWVGTRSYSIYLTHLVGFGLTREIWHRLSPAATTLDAGYTLAFLATGFFLTLILSEFNYRLIEVPFRRQGKHAASAVQARLAIEDLAAGRVVAHIGEVPLPVPPLVLVGKVPLQT